MQGWAQGRAGREAREPVLPITCGWKPRSGDVSPPTPPPSFRRSWRVSLGLFTVSHHSLQPTVHPGSAPTPLSWTEAVAPSLPPPAFPPPAAGGICFASDQAPIPSSPSVSGSSMPHQTPPPSLTPTPGPSFLLPPAVLQMCQLPGALCSLPEGSWPVLSPLRSWPRPHPPQPPPWGSPLLALP